MRSTYKVYAGILNRKLTEGKSSGQVLLARSGAGVRDMMKRYRKFLIGKRLLLSPEKSKVMIYEKGRGRGRSWRWGKKP